MNYHLAADGISLTLTLVTGLTAVCAVLFSWKIETRPNEFFFWLLLVVGGSYGVFLSADLFLFFVFYELVIVPKYFLIAIWGSTNKEYGAMKLTLYSFLGGALVFIGILAIYTSAGSLDLQQLAQFQFPSLTASVGFPGPVPWVRDPRRHLAVAHLGADRPCRGADGRLDAAGRDRDEARRLRRAARRAQSLSVRLPDVEQMDRGLRRHRDCLRGGGRAAAERSQVCHRLLERQPHGLHPARAGRGKCARRLAARSCKCSRTA